MKRELITGRSNKDGVDYTLCKSVLKMLHFFWGIQSSKSSKAFAERLRGRPPNLVVIVLVGLVLCFNPCQI